MAHACRKIKGKKNIFPGIKSINVVCAYVHYFRIHMKKKNIDICVRCSIEYIFCLGMLHVQIFIGKFNNKIYFTAHIR